MLRSTALCKATLSDCQPLQLDPVIAMSLPLVNTVHDLYKGTDSLSICVFLVIDCCSTGIIA